MAVYEIPLIVGTPQKFAISLGGTQYTFTIRWNMASNVWALDIADADEVPLVRGIALVTGIDVLEQFKYLRIGDPNGQLWVQSRHTPPDTLPTFNNLGGDAGLYYIIPYV